MPDFMTTIGEVADVYDGPHATPKKIDHGPYFLSISSLVKGALELTQSAHLCEEDFVKWTKRVTPRAGDVLFSYETRLGDAALMLPNIRACLGRRMGLLRPNTEKVIPEYLLYAYLSPAFQEVIKARTIHGATVNRIALKELPEFPIRIPPKDEQQLVVNILNSIDSKIQLNRKINQTLEQIAQAIFKSWFVDFEPVKAKIEAKHSLTPTLSERERELFVERAAMRAISGKTDDELEQLSHELQRQLAAIVAHFPDEFEETELGEIPKGWKVERIDGLLELAYGKALKSADRLEGAIPVYGSGGITGYHNEPLVDGPGIIVGRKGTVGSLHWEDEAFFPIDTVFYVIPKAPLTFCFYLLQILGLDRMNTDAAVPGLNRNNVYRLNISVDIVLAKYFDRIVKPLHEHMFINNRQSRVLSEIRDSLLPKLLSGEIRLDDTQSNAEAAA